MTPERYQRVREVYHRVCDESQSQWPVLLDEACGDDAELRAAVETLLDAESEADDFLESPETIGRYRIVRVLGRGGMGVVYEAEQDDPRRRVALKVLARGFVTPSLLQRFRLEAQVLGQLHHPGIAQIYEAGTADAGAGGQPYFAMELVAGARLTEHARKAGLDTRQRLDLFARICDAVEHAHCKGVIHRDLKPDNILVRDDGTPKILDFGIARATDSDIQMTTHETAAGQVIGTVPYMSPEQVAGDVRNIDTRTDIYALGVVLYELLSGRLPHDLAHRSIPEAARVICDEEHTRLSSISTAFRGDIDTIVAKALAKEPNRRYASAAALAADIRRYLGDRPIVARPTSTFYQLRKFVHRNRGLSIGAAAAVLTLVAGTIVSTWLYVKAEQRRRVADWQSYVASVTAAGASLMLHNYGEARRRLELAPREHRGWEWRHWYLAQDLSLRRVEGHQARVTAMAISANGRRIVTTDVYRARVWDLPAWTLVDEVEWATHAPGLRTYRHGTVAISPDGRQVVAGGRLQWEPGSGIAPIRLPVREGKVEVVTLTDAGRAAVVGTERGGVHVIDLETGEPTAPAWYHDAAVVSIAADPVGGRIVFGSVDGTVRIRDREGGGLELEVGATVTAVTFDPEGARVATGDDNGRVVLWDSVTGARLDDLPGHAKRITVLAFHPDGVRLASGSEDGTVRVSDTRSGRLLARLGAHENQVASLAVSPDGQWIVSGGGDLRRPSTVRVWDADTRSASTAVPIDTGYLLEVAFSPDGTRIVACAAEATHVLDAATGDLLLSVAVPADAMAVVGDAIVIGHMRSDLSVWSLATGEQQAGYPVFAGSVFAHPNGTSIVTGANATTTLVDLAEGTCHALDGGAGRYSVAISVDEGLVISSSRGFEDGRLQLFEPESSRAWTLDGHRGSIQDIALHPDGRHVVTASLDAMLRVWDIHERRCVHVLRGHDGDARSVDVSPDGRRIVSGSDDHSVRLWDFETGDALATLIVHDHQVVSVGFSPDGRRIVSGDMQGTVRIWETELDSARRMWRAAARAGR